MKGLIKLVNNNKDAIRLIRNCDVRGVSIFHRKYGHSLRLNDHLSEDGTLPSHFVFNHGGYGSSVMLGADAKMHTRWKMEGTDADVPRNKPLTGTQILFLGDSWQRDIEEQRALVQKCGGTIIDAFGPTVDVVVTGENAHKRTINKARKNPVTLVVSEETFQRVLPQPKDPNKPRKKAMKRLSSTMNSLFKLFSERDFDLIAQGLELLESLEDNEAYDELLTDVSLGAGNVLLRGRRFSGTKPQQPYLDFVLLSILSSSPEGSKGFEIRTQLQQLKLENQLRPPPLVGFQALRSLSITVGTPVGFADLTSFGRLPSLETLHIEPGDKSGWGDKTLLSIAGLDAPALTEIQLLRCQVSALRPLANCTRLEKVVFTGCKSLHSIEGLVNSKGLKHINLKRCHRITTLSALSNAARLQYCNFDGVGVVDVSGLANKPNISYLNLNGCTIQSTEAFVAIENWIGSAGGYSSNALALDLSKKGDLSGLRGLNNNVTSLDISVHNNTQKEDLSSLPLLPQIQKLKLNHKNLHSLKGLEALPNLTELTIERAPLDTLDLPKLPHLTTLRIDRCWHLTDLKALSGYRNLTVAFNNCSSLTNTNGLEQIKNIQFETCENISSLAGISPEAFSVHLSYYRSSATSLSAGSPCLHDSVTPILSFKNMTALQSLRSLGSTPRPHIKGLNLLGCSGLTSLDGIQSLPELRYINLQSAHQPIDFSALQKRQSEMVLALSIQGSQIPKERLSELAKIPQLGLVLRVTNKDFSLDGIEKLSNLVGLDLVCKHADSSLTMQDIKAVLELKNLKSLRLPKSSLPPRCGPIAEGSTNERSIQNLRKALAKALGIKLVAAPPTPKIKGLRSTVSKIKKLIVSCDTDNIKQALELVCSAQIDEVWDQLVGDINPKTVFISGNSKADLAGLGSPFSKCKFSDAATIRWAVLHLIASAPEGSATAELRKRITTISLSASEGSGWSAKFAYPSIPKLSNFPALRNLTILGQINERDLQWLTGTSLQHLSLPNMPTLKSLDGLDDCTALVTLGLGAKQLTSIDALKGLEHLQSFALSSKKVNDLSPLSSAVNLRALQLFQCTKLTSLSGVEQATKLCRITLTECPVLQDLSALANKAQLCEAPSNVSTFEHVQSSYCTSHFGYPNTTSGRLDLSSIGEIEDLEFLGTQQAVTEINIIPNATSDLRPLSRLPALQKLTLHLKQPNIKLRGLEKITVLHIKGTHSPNVVDAMPALQRLHLNGTASSFEDCWPELPALDNLVIDQPDLTSMSWLKAPALDSVTIKSATLDDCGGIGHSRSLSLPSLSRWGSQKNPVLRSLSGIENNLRIRWLNLSLVSPEANVQALATLPALLSLDNGANTAIESLQQAENIVWLSLHGYGKKGKTSLSFLRGWTALKILILTDTGVLSDLDVLETLPSLQKIQLRGSETKRALWPEALQSRIDFVAGYSDTSFRRPTS